MTEDWKPTFNLPDGGHVAKLPPQQVLNDIKSAIDGGCTTRSLGAIMARDHPDFVVSLGYDPDNSAADIWVGMDASALLDYSMDKQQVSYDQAD